jgi:DNA-binding protein YbaB
MDPQQWLLEYDEKLKEVAARAEQAEQTLAKVGGEATSAGGDITVRVSASGVTTDLVLRPGIRDVEPEQLARMILDTTRQAQRDAGAQVVEAMKGLVGEGPALDVVKSKLPEGYAGDGNDEPANPDLRPDTRPDDEYFDNPPEVIQ